MSDNQLIREIRLQNFLSYADLQLELGPLNVLVGTNGSGKSNLIEAFRLLQATPKDFTVPIREGGGINKWLYKSGPQSVAAKLEIVMSTPQVSIPLRYGIEFTSVAQRTEVLDEYVENQYPLGNEKDVYFFYRYQRGDPVLNVKSIDTQSIGTPRNKQKQPNNYQDYRPRRLQREDLSPDQSVLSQRTDREIYPEIALLGQNFNNIHIYSDWDVGLRGKLRRPQPADLPNNFLNENAGNLALVLNNLILQGYRSKLVKDLQQLYEGVTDINAKIEGGTVQLYLHEKDSVTIPTTRLSDGTLRYLCLLSVLRHPNPPSLICIEEPELGMHPDVMPAIAELLIDASTRTQIIITTHSDALISSLTFPEMVLICERDDEGSTIRRLDTQKLKSWLDKYTLGDLWRMGEIGGTRW